MAGLGTEVRAKVDPRLIRPCGVGVFVAEQLDDEDRADLAALLPDPSVKTTFLYDRLAARGLTLRYNALLLHRRGRCGCGRTA